ncbi:pyridoxamine 5'-phosphate oxidase family protein [Sulfurimonas sp.]|uniref:pyridoxamine 5'-phosphate oxidase family protein n=1 Tax=Sulfurimonas sp. TaxID=2022749 RepID=UPI0025D99A3D|nr:pyridoxamine 5'-phosphate oxidase family protein [Sulfurimonas sp.]
MRDDLEKIVNFINKHHVLSLATSCNSELSVCNLFYAFDENEVSFVVASSEETTHIEHILQNPNIAGSIVLETKTIGKIQGLQFRGRFSFLEEKMLKKLYFKTFPYALAMNPKLWQIKIDYLKMTDNNLVFGKKIILHSPFVQT